MMTPGTNTLKNRSTDGGFTFIEVLVSLAILGIMLSSTFISYERTLDNVTGQTLEQRALSVAQRQMEILIATRQEPDSDQTSGWDEFDPLFTWHLTLLRESFGTEPPKPDLSNTVIKATVTVEWDTEEDIDYRYEETDFFDEDENFDEFDEFDEFEDDWDKEGWDERPENRYENWEDDLDEQNSIQLVRYFAHSGFKPIPGQPVAVPLTRETPPSPQWYVDLMNRLGREPTPEEVIKELFKQNEIPQEMLEHMDFGDEVDFEDEPEDDEDRLPLDDMSETILENIMENNR